mmetsp:Transcript_5426/g.7569  ORF Transcript_5426/g.7569 Transcript_5426/m.7569 type:complete len:378 (-) Transcript_5426:197-1330(-)
MVRLTLCHGLSEYTPFAFDVFGMILSVLGRRNEALRFGQLALEIGTLVSPGGRRQVDSQTLVVVHSFTRHWHDSIRESVEPFRIAFRRGIKCGEIGFGLLAGFSGILAANTMGASVVHIEESADELCRRSSMYRHAVVKKLALPLWQFALNLRGQCHDKPWILTGEAMEEATLLGEALATGNGFVHGNALFFKMVLLVYFHQWKDATEVFEQLMAQPHAKSTMAHFSAFEFIFYGKGLAYFALAQKTGQRKHKSKALHATNTLKRWARKSSGAAEEYLKAILSFLAAEKKALLLMAKNATHENGTILFREYDKAIAACGNFAHLRALIRERAASFIENQFVDEARARLVYLQAQKDWNTYGATAKVEQLEEKLWGTP